jgi:hypothetical protein
MAENKMEQVAKLFGKELGEEFKLRYFNHRIRSRFTKDGLEEHYLTSKWLLNGELLQMLLTGEAVIVND